MSVRRCFNVASTLNCLLGNHPILLNLYCICITFFCSEFFITNMHAMQLHLWTIKFRICFESFDKFGPHLRKLWSIFQIIYGEITKCPKVRYVMARLKFCRTLMNELLSTWSNSIDPEAIVITCTCEMIWFYICSVICFLSDIW